MRFILCMRPANERWRYNVTSSLIGWAHAQNDPCSKYANATMGQNSRIGLILGPVLAYLRCIKDEIIRQRTETGTYNWHRILMHTGKSFPNCLYTRQLLKFIRFNLHTYLILYIPVYNTMEYVCFLQFHRAIVENCNNTAQHGTVLLT